SGAALATRLEPVMPPAPGTFSITTCWPRISLNRAARMRASVSIGPPAAYGTTMVIARVGQSCALAVKGASRNAIAATALPMIFRMTSFRELERGLVRVGDTQSGHFLVSAVSPLLGETRQAFALRRNLKARGVQDHGEVGVVAVDPGD